MLSLVQYNGRDLWSVILLAFARRTSTKSSTSLTLIFKIKPKIAMILKFFACVFGRRKEGYGRVELYIQIVNVLDLHFQGQTIRISGSLHILRMAELGNFSYVHAFERLLRLPSRNCSWPSFLLAHTFEISLVCYYSKRGFVGPVQS